MGRNIDTVINDMLGLIPKEETELRMMLTRVRQDAGFKAPESQSISWEKGQHVLERRFPNGPGQAEWELAVLQIWSGR